MPEFSRCAAVFAALAVIVSGCAKNPDKISATYVSPIQYQNYTCEQIGEEYKRISVRVAEVSGMQEDARERDSVATGVGVVLFWPAVFFLAAGDHEDELARLKGEYEALERAAIEKECDIADAMREAQEARAKLEAERKAKKKEFEENRGKPRFG